MQVSWCQEDEFDSSICHVFCGGSIYNERTIITAAHCCEQDWGKWPYIYTKIVAGELDLKVSSGLEQTRWVKSHTIHPDYNKATFPPLQHDICLLTLDSPLELNRNVRRINLDEEDPMVATKCQVSGWGSLAVSIQSTLHLPKYISEHFQDRKPGEVTYEYPLFLQWTEVMIKSDNYCSKVYYENTPLGYDRLTMVCAFAPVSIGFNYQIAKF